MVFFFYKHHTRDIMLGDDIKKQQDVLKQQIYNTLQKFMNMQEAAMKNELAEISRLKAKEKIKRAEEAIEAIDPDASEWKSNGLQLAEAVVQDAEDYVEMLWQFVEGMEKDLGEKVKIIKDKVDEEFEKRYDDSNDEWVHILHLSDLHFGIYYNTEGEEQSKWEFDNVVKTKLFDFFKKYIGRNRIDIIAITGDISYRNNEKGYEDFKVWLKEFCSKDILNLDIRKKVIMCPGNHDSGYDNRNKDGLVSQEEADKNEKLIGADDVLIMDKLSERQKQFKFFNDTCSSLKIQKLDNFKQLSRESAVPYVIGKRKIKEIDFVVLNTAWNAFPQVTKEGENNGYCHGQLFLGRRLLNVLFTELEKKNPTVMLFHHPLSWMHETEIRTYGKDAETPAIKRVINYSDIILNGHIHGEIEPPDLLANKTLVFSGGTLYDDKTAQFEIISINMTNHYCTQKVVSYNRHERNGSPIGWEEVGENYLPQFHFGVARDERELMTKICLGEVTAAEALALAQDRGIITFGDVYRKSKYYHIHKIINQFVEEHLTQLEPSLEQIRQKERE